MKCSQNGKVFSTLKEGRQENFQATSLFGFRNTALQMKTKFRLLNEYSSRLRDVSLEVEKRQYMSVAVLLPSGSRQLKINVRTVVVGYDLFSICFHRAIFFIWPDFCTLGSFIEK